MDWEDWEIWEWEYYLLVSKKEIEERPSHHPSVLNDPFLYPEQLLEKVCISEYYEFIEFI
jgi:hypothetical protein